MARDVAADGQFVWAPHVGADLQVMRDDTQRMRPNPETRPWVMTNLKTQDGLAAVVAFIEKRGMLGAAEAA